MADCGRQGLGYGQGRAGPRIGGPAQAVCDVAAYRGRQPRDGRAPCVRPGERDGQDRAAAAYRLEIAAF